jgi:RND superfamily putative drug exporter
MFHFLGRFTARHAWIICTIWLVGAVGLALAAPSWDTQTQDDDIRFLPARCPSVRGYQLLEQSFPQDVFASRAIFALERSDRPLSPEDLDLANQLVTDLNQLRESEPDLHLGRINSHQDPFIGKRLLSADRQCVLIQVSLGTPFLALQTRTAVDRAEAVVRARLNALGKDAPRLLVTGPAGVGRDLTRASADSLHGTTIATIVLVLVVLLLVYRAPLLALVPLLTIALSTWVALSLLALLTLIPGVYLVNVSKVFAIVLLYGAGTDYCLFLISRYREELTNGLSFSHAITRSVQAVGASLAASAGTVICGLGLMGFAEFAKVRCAGPAIGLSLAVVLLASLTLAPALLHLLGQRVFWPQKVRVRPRNPLRETLWDRISHHVVARPVLIWSIAFVVLAPLALLGLGVKANFKPTGELSPKAESVQGVAAIQRHFTAGEIGPITVLLSGPVEWSSPAGREAIGHLSRSFSRLGNVAEVRSLTQPLGAPLEGAGTRGPAKGLLGVLQSAVNVQGRIDQAVREAYVGKVVAPDGAPRSVTRLDVVLRTDPFAPESLATLRLLQTWLRDQLPHAADGLGEVQAECYGVTVNACDLAEVTESDRARVNWLVLGGVFLILLVLVRRLDLAAYLLVTVLFSYLATLGMTALLGTLFNNRPFGEVDWRVPFFLFTILIAVGEDYNILLMSRAVKERERHGAREGVRRALARTGGAITSCGLIMAGTFATLMLAGLGTLVQVGFALAFGVLVDTFVVRPFLVPAFAVVLWQREEKPIPIDVKPPLRRAPAPLRRAA